MIMINKIILYNINDAIKEYYFKKNTLIIGTNSSGKTNFFKLIDYMLGSSDEDLLSTESIEKINFAEMEIIKDGTSYFFKRSLNKKLDCFYKYDTKYTQCNLDAYKQEINQLLSKNKNYNDIYSTVFNQDISYRVFSFLNKIEANNKSISISLFSTSQKHIYRNRVIMNFLFNYDNIKNIANKIKEKEKLENKYAEKETEKRFIEFIKTELKDKYDILSIKYNNDELKDLLDEKIINKINAYYSNASEYNFDDYTYYLAKLNTIDNQLKEYEFINQQLKFMNDKHQNSINLLENFNGIVKNSSYKEYTEDILTEIEKFKDKIVINNLLDIKKIIKQLHKQRKEVINIINSINAPFKNNNFIDTVNNIELAKKYIEILKNYKQFNNYDIKEEINKLKKQIKELELLFDDKLLNEFNSDLTDTYINLSQDITCVREDKQRNNLMLEFEHLKNKLMFVEKYSNNITENNFVDKLYDPGSDGRYIIIRVITHLCMFKFLNKHFNGLPVFPILLIDGLDHAIDKSINSFIQDFTKIATEHNIQTISFCKDEHNININDDIEIINFNKELNGGFNPWLEK